MWLVRIAALSDGLVQFEGMEETCACEFMSALPPIADMCSALANVRYGPIADMPLISGPQDTAWNSSPYPLFSCTIGSKRAHSLGEAQMPLYHFVLKTRDDLIPDRDGSGWPNEAAAREEAIIVADDLMGNQGVKTHAWRIEVCDEDLRPCSELLFAEVDESTSHLPPAVREPHIITSRRMAALSDAVLTLRRTLVQVSETLSHADTVMAAVAGKRG